MFKRGDLLMSYDEEDIVKSEIEFIKETWDEDFAKEHGKNPTDEQIDKIVWNRLSDGWAYQNGWEMFVESLTELMKERNPRLTWESPDYHSSDDGYEKEDAKFQLSKGQELLSHFVDFDRHGNLSYVKIFAFGNNGFCIDPEWQTEKCLLDACKSGFYRDWNRGGVCVSSKVEE